MAEEMIYNHQTTGAASDIKQATSLIRKLICDYGMTEELGPISYGEKDEQIFLGREISRHRDYSDKTAEAIDSLMRKMIEEQLKRARDILSAHREQLDLLAAALLEHELLDREEIMIVISGDTLRTAKKSRTYIRQTSAVTVGAEPAVAPVLDGVASDDTPEETSV